MKGHCHSSTTCAGLVLLSVRQQMSAMQYLIALALRCVVTCYVVGHYTKHMYCALEAPFTT